MFALDAQNVDDTFVLVLEPYRISEHRSARPVSPMSGPEMYGSPVEFAGVKADVHEVVQWL